MLFFTFIVGCDQAGTEKTVTLQEKETIVNPEKRKFDHSIESDDLENNLIPAKISRVVDGDTVIVILADGTEERVRLLLIDTPESVHPSKQVQPFGKESSDFAKELMPVGSKVGLELDIGERDRYGRLLAYVWVGKQMVNELMLEKGYARVAYVFAPNTRHVDRFYAIQKEAQKRGVGIWSIENYVQEQGFNEEVIEEVQPDKINQPLNCNEPLIKGNRSSNGELIFHVPGGQFYERTIAEEMFCTEEEAITAGYRKSLR